MSANNSADSAGSNTEATDILLRRQIIHLQEENNRLRQENKKYVFAVSCKAIRSHFPYLLASMLALTLIVLQDESFDGWSHLLIRSSQ